MVKVPADQRRRLVDVLPEARKQQGAGLAGDVAGEGEEIVGSGHEPRLDECVDPAQRS